MPPFVGPDDYNWLAPNDNTDGWEEVERRFHICLQ